MADTPLASNHLPSSNRCKQNRRRPWRRIQIELLEDRTVPSYFPPTTNGIHVFEDQIPSGLSNAMIQFLATHTDGTQKQTLSQINQFRAINSNYTLLAYQLGTGNSPFQYIINGQWSSDWTTVNANESYFAHQTYSGEPQSASNLSSGRVGTDVSNSSPTWDQADIANPAWQQYTLAQVLQNMAATGANGWFADSFTYGIGGAGYNGTIPTRYQTTNAANPADWPGGVDWTTQLGNWAQAVENAFSQSNTANGTNYKFIPNLDARITGWEPHWYDNASGVPIMDGAFLEGFGETTDTADWTLSMNQGLNFTDNGKIVIMQPYLQGTPDSATGQQERNFYLGTYLLLKGDESYLNMEYGTSPQYFPEYQLNLGSATTPLPSNVSGYLWNGVYRRDFQNGFVLVNPGTTTHTLSLGGTFQEVQGHGGGALTASQLDANGNYIGGSLTFQNLSSITLAGGTAVIFLNPSSGATVSGSSSTVSFASATVSSGSADVITIKVLDTTGAVISGLSGNAFSFSLAEGTCTGTFGSVTESSTKGTYTAAFTGATAGTPSTLTAVVNNVTLSGQPTITVTAGAISGSKSISSFASSTLTSGSTDVLTIVVKDAAGNAISGLANSAFNLSLSGGTSAGTLGAVAETSTKGTYTATFTGTTAGTASTLKATVSGVALNSQPTITVNAGAASGSTSSASFASGTVASGGADVLTIVVKDSNGNAVTGLSNSAFVLSLAGGTSTGTFAAIIETGTKGTYTTTFTAGTTAGSASTLTTTVSGVNLTAKPTVQVLAGQVSASKTTVVFTTATVASGSADQLTLVVMDAGGNAITGLSSGAFTFSLSGGTSTGTFSIATETATKGTYTASFTGLAAGTTSTLTATVSGVALASKPSVTVSAGPVSGSMSSVSFAAATVASGGTDVLTLVVKDAAGNAISGMSSSVFGLSLAGGTSNGTFSAVTETATKGTYISTFIASGTAGTASTLTATVNSVGLTSKPTVQVVVGGISATNSIASFAAASIASGSTDVLTIVVKDGGNNAISGLSSSAFGFSLAGGTTSGTFGSAVETATKGTYTATFTGTTAGSVSTLTVSVSGVTLSSRPTITVNAGPVSGSVSTLRFASPSVASGGTDIVTVVVKDAAGNAVTGLTNSAFGFSLAGGTSTGTIGTVIESATKGTYTALFTGVKAGTATTLTVTVNAVPLTSKPTITVSAGSASGSTSSVGLAAASVTQGATDLLTIVVKDAAGNPVGGLANSAFGFSLAGGTSAGTIGAVTESATKGTYSALFTGTAAGSADTLTVSVNNVTLGSPSTITVSPGSAGQGPTVNAVATQTVGDGATLSFTVTATSPSGGAMTFSLGAGVLPGVSINAQTGVVTLAPSEWNGTPPGVYTITVNVAEANNPALVGTTTFDVIVGPSSTDQGSGMAARSTTALGLTQSAEYYSNIIVAAYNKFLGRSPEASGLAYWLNRMQNQGLSDEHLEAGFIGSVEYINNHGGAGAGWVKGMYLNLLGRAPAQSEVQYWLTQLTAGMLTTDIAYGFAASRERESQRVNADYQQYLGRGASQAEVDYWVNVFLNGGSNEKVIAGFVSSQEYFQVHGNNVVDWLFEAYRVTLNRQPDAAGYQFWLSRLE